MKSDSNQISEILDYWFSEAISKQWFASTAKLDTEIKQKFESLWADAAEHKLDSWLTSADGCLALCILLDQLPLNMFRGDSKSFATEQQAVAVTKYAINEGLDAEITDEKVSFLYMPLMHSEKIEDQDLSVACFDKHNLENNLRFAEHHRGIIREFGRFPHRNAILGRENTADEIDYLNSKRAFTG